MWARVSRQESPKSGSRGCRPTAATVPNVRGGAAAPVRGPIPDFRHPGGIGPARSTTTAWLLPRSDAGIGPEGPIPDDPRVFFRGGSAPWGRVPGPCARGGGWQGADSGGPAHLEVDGDHTVRVVLQEAAAGGGGA